MLDNLRRYLGAGGEASDVSGDVPAEALPTAGIPNHIAIIMDGNGRWATERGLPKVAGHRAGVDALRRTVRGCRELGVRHLTVYAFSTENWKRPKEEVDALFHLLIEYCRREISTLVENGVKVKVIGRLNELPLPQRRALERAVERTQQNTDLCLHMALNYGAHAELVDAVRSILAEVQSGRLRSDQVDDACIADHLYTAGTPDPDLIIRTAGEMRLSNFLLWQAAYAELWVTPVYWPDFGREQLEQAVREYQQRQRLFGSTRPHRPAHGG